jgi:hypothetical protein
MWALCDMWGRGTMESVGGFGIYSKLLGECKTFPWKMMWGMEKDVCILCVIFNGKWMKDSSLLWCIIILLSVGSSVGYVIPWVNISTFL